MSKVKLFSLYVLILFLTGCATTQIGNITNPYIPASSENTLNSEQANIYFYRTADLAGSLKFHDMNVVIDYNPKQEIKNNHTDYEHIMTANRNHYMMLSIDPGVHVFGFNAFPKVVAKLEAGRDYYLAVAFEPYFLFYGLFNGRPILEFRGKEDFLIETEGDQEIIYTGECGIFFGCDYKVKDTQVY